jgi:hypothetical protein
MEIRCEFCQQPARLICTKEGMAYRGPEDNVTRPVLYPLCVEHWETSSLYTIVCQED